MPTIKASKDFGLFGGVLSKLPIELQEQAETPYRPLKEVYQLVELIKDYFHLLNNKGDKYNGIAILETATYELTLPSSDVQVKYRPFLVKEEKLLLMLKSEDSKEIVEALKEIVSVCTFGNLNVNELPTFDLEYIFLNIRQNQ